MSYGMDIMEQYISLESNAGIVCSRADTRNKRARIASALLGVKLDW